MPKQSEPLPGSSLASKLSNEVMTRCLSLLALDPEKADLERERVLISRIRESNRGVSGEIKRIATILEAKRLGMQREADSLA